MVSFLWRSIGSECHPFQLRDFGVTISFAFSWSCFHRRPIPAFPFAWTVQLEAWSRISYTTGVTECCAENMLNRGKRGRKETGYSLPIRFQKRGFGLETCSHLCEFRKTNLDLNPRPGLIFALQITLCAQCSYQVFPCWLIFNINTKCRQSLGSSLKPWGLLLCHVSLFILL